MTKRRGSDTTKKKRKRAFKEPPKRRLGELMPKKMRNKPPRNAAEEKPGSPTARARAWLKAILERGTRTSGVGEVAAQIAG